MSIHNYVSMHIIRYTIVVGVVLIFFGCTKDAKINIYMIGDSTMAPKSEEQRPKTGWGEVLSEYFSDDVRIQNYAKNGRSTKSFIDEGRWQLVLDSLNQGDYLIIQFGHNDQKSDNPVLYASPDEYEANLKTFIDESSRKGAIPILMNPIVRRRFDAEESFFDTHGKYPSKSREIANKWNVLFVDMHLKSLEMVVQSGPEISKDFFLWLKPGESVNYPEGVEDNTHFSPFGARKMAYLAVEGIADLDTKLNKYLKIEKKCE
jgi:lysophospholipase L1-like esterase